MILAANCMQARLSSNGKARCLRRGLRLKKYREVLGHPLSVLGGDSSSRHRPRLTIAGLSSLDRHRAGTNDGAASLPVLFCLRGKEHRQARPRPVPGPCAQPISRDLVARQADEPPVRPVSDTAVNGPALMPACDRHGPQPDSEDSSAESIFETHPCARSLCRPWRGSASSDGRRLRAGTSR